VVLFGFIYFLAEPRFPSCIRRALSAARRKAFVAIMLLVTVAVVAGAIRLLFQTSLQVVGNGSAFGEDFFCSRSNCAAVHA